MHGQSKREREAAFEAILTHEYDDFERYVKDIASQHAIGNSGFEVVEFVDCRSKPADGMHRAWIGFTQLAESDEMYDSFHEEREGWLDESRDDAERVRGVGLPLTLTNARLVFEQTGPFAR